MALRCTSVNAGQLRVWRSRWLGRDAAASVHRTQPHTPHIDVCLHMHLEKHRIGPCGPARVQACILQALHDSEHLRREREEHVQVQRRAVHVHVSAHVRVRVHVRGCGHGHGRRGRMRHVEYPTEELVHGERGELRGRGVHVREAARGAQCRDGGER
jgi:hypothetical protein